MIETSFDTRVKIQQIISNNLPEFLREESPKAAEFLKQYYISQEFQSGVVDIAENLDQYLKLDNLTPEIINDNTKLSYDIDSTVGVITVSSTKGFPSTYGLLKIDDEIITYTGLTTNTFTGCIRGFSGITKYSNNTNTSNLDEFNYKNDLVFSTSTSSSHIGNTKVINLSTLFLKEFYKKLKYALTPGLENIDLNPNLNVNNFIKSARSFYQSKGSEESFRILFLVLYGIEPKVIDLETYLIKPSAAKFIRRKVIVTELVSSGDPLKLVGQTIKNNYDLSAQASVSEVEIFTRKGKSYYKLYLFIGYNENELIDGTFKITGKTKVLNTVSPGSSVISVDSTLGFPSSGSLVSGNNTIKYTDKSINQFFNCSGVIEEIPIKSDIRSDEIIYGYENGDLTKKVELRITGSLSEISPDSKTLLSYDGDKIFVKNVGEKILNPEENKSFKEVLANSFIYNTSTRHQVSEISGSTFKLKTKIDKSSLKIGDYVDILVRGGNNIQGSNIIINDINFQSNELILGELQNFIFNPTLEYDVRRKIKYAKSLNTPLEFGNNSIISDVGNLYVDENYAYVASNSLPSYEIDTNLVYHTISVGYNTPTKSYLQGQITDSSSIDYQKYSIISFDENVKFITGDEVVYVPENTELPGLISGDSYYVEVLSPSNQIRLYQSRSFIGISNFVVFDQLNSNESHKFILSSNKDGKISPQKILKKLNLIQNDSEVGDQETSSGNLGLLSNGVEIYNYKSQDNIYYGPIEKIEVFNGGSGYDVVRPPQIIVGDSPNGTASATVTVSGKVTNVLVDPQDFDIENVISISLTGGNGTGASFLPVIEKRPREVEFDSRFLIDGGGIDPDIDETITFTKKHYFENGERVFYDSNGNDSIGIATYNGSNISNSFLSNGSAYYAQVVNPKTIKLYPTLEDYSSGINTVGFSTASNFGVHKFRTSPKNTLSSIKILNPGEGYTNHKILVNSTGISTYFNTITYTSHNFNSGDLIRYEALEGSEVIGISTSNYYLVTKIDDNTFKLSDAGLDGKSTDDYNRKKYIEFSDPGSEYHIFKYPEIELNVQVSYGSSQTEEKSIIATPVVTGSIKSINISESGIGYGSSVLNFEKKPKITVRSGEYAQVKPYISQGKIVKVNVLSSGSNYYSTPKLVVNGSGTGCILRPVIEQNKLKRVIVINPGVGYDANTTVSVLPSGSGAVFNPRVRKLTLDNFYRYGKDILVDTNNNLEYEVIGYTPSLASEFRDDGSKHSPIIGWAYDGNPIYGPYGYSDPDDLNSEIKRLISGYSLDSGVVYDRPADFPEGFFIEDYKYTDEGDLDLYNGRYCKTPEFPNGIYAYFCSTTDDPESASFKPFYPYFIGSKYKSPIISDNWSIDQTYDFNNSSLVRNTLPYKVSEKHSDYEFFIESNEIIKQTTEINSVYPGSIDSLRIIDGGNDYRIGDVCSFDSESSEGGGLSAIVSSLQGKEISNVSISNEKYQNVVFEWNKDFVVASYYPYFDILDGDTVTITGLGTYISKLDGQKVCSVQTDRITLLSNLSTNVVPNKIEDIYVSKITPSVSVGSSLVISEYGIGPEIVSVLNIFENGSILRIMRSDVGYAHTVLDSIDILPNRLNFPISTNNFDSKINQKIHFNPKQSVGIGTTTGIGINLSETIGGVTRSISVPTQSIKIPNHPFKTGDSAILRKKLGRSPIIVSDTSDSPSFSLLPTTTLFENVYVINKTKDLIGITTILSNAFTTNGLFLLGPIPIESDYSIETNYTQVKGEIQQNIATITTKEEHGLLSNDIINLKVDSNINTGIGSFSSVGIAYSSSSKKILVNPITFDSSDVDLDTNRIYLPEHNLKTGDKVFYQSDSPLITGLSTNGYYVYKVDDNYIQLSHTYADTQKQYPNIIKLESVGSNNQRISLINPEFVVERSNSIVFDVSDSSLDGYKLNLFYDNQFKNKFVSVGISSQFNFSGVGTPGSNNAQNTLSYVDGMPSKLYYNISKDGLPLEVDENVINYSSITFVNNKLNGLYSISGVGSTTFDINLTEYHKKTSYLPSECNVLEYSTTSRNAKGGVDNIKILNGGYGYKKLPIFKEIISDVGKNANIVPYSKTIGKINNYKIYDQGFDYSSDKTLRPEIDVSSVLILKDSSEIQRVDILDGGMGYSSPPKVILKNPITGSVIDNGSLTCDLQSGTVSKINVISPIKGISSTESEIIFTENTNGIGINSIQASISGVVTCVLVTPIISGFIDPPFSVGDEIFVENIAKEGEIGDGFNSADYDYTFFKVTAFENTNPAVLEYNLSGLTTNPGFAKTSQLGYASIINKNKYPVTEVFQVFSRFNKGENLLCDFGSGFINTDLVVVESSSSYIKAIGSDLVNLRNGNVLKGFQTGSIATIVEIISNSGRFIIDYSTDLNYGWSDQTGKLSESYQVIPDNDYYQNLSYSVKSPIEYEDFIDSVNRIVHISGLKNFADTQIESKSTKVSYGGTSNETIVLDVLDESRVDIINNYSSAIDIDTFDNKSKYLQFRDITLTDYIDCISNVALTVDDVSRKFSSKSNERDLYTNLYTYLENQLYSKYLVQVTDVTNNEYQLDEVVVLFYDKQIYTLEKSSVLTANEKLGDIKGEVDEYNTKTLRFTPSDPYETDYDVKYLQTYFSDLDPNKVGILTQSIGSIDLMGISTSVGVGLTSNILSIPVGKNNGLVANIFVLDTVRFNFNYIEVVVDNDGSNTYLAEYYFDNNAGISTNYLGTFDSNIESGILKFNVTNNVNTKILVNANIVGFGSTASGIGTFRFKYTDQPDGSERNAKFESNFTSSSGISTVFKYKTNEILGSKSLIRVSYGNTSSIHQLLCLQNGSDIYLTQYPYLSSNLDSSSGIGTFGAYYSGQETIIAFYPDQSITSVLKIQSYNQLLYSFNDFENESLTPVNKLQYGNVEESVKLSAYDGLNGPRANKVDFDLNHLGTPIFRKIFNPSDPTVLNQESGVITIRNHFFTTGERLIYTPKSTFIGVGETSIGIGLTSNSVGVVTNRLPNEVYAIRLTDDTLQLSTRKDYALAGIYVTFTSSGEGNAHQLEMYKKLEKSIISIDGVVQKPLSYTPIAYKLQDNGGQIGITTNYFAMSGIATIQPNDILKVDDEYMQVLSVGFAQTSKGPIVGIGSYSVIYVNRGYVGTSATSHGDGSEARIYKGSFNINSSKIYFTQPPRGSARERRDSSNLPYPTSSFAGRVFLRSDYTNNKLYDDISDQFDGISSDYRLSVQGINTTGIETGSGVLFINGVFQTPTTENNFGNNYSYEGFSGITSVIFTGITSSNGQVINSLSDVNQNQLPRGGLIVSLGSTPGLGYAPLVGASVTAILNPATGSIISVGIGTTDIIGSGYRNPVSVAVTDAYHTGSAAAITAVVGLGGTLSFNVVSGGSGYVKPTIIVSEPSYQNLPVTGVFRRGIGNTTETGTNLLVSLDVGPSSTTGIGSTYFEVKEFKISRAGYGFQVGDIITPVGLVTDRRLNAPIEQFQLTVLDTFTDSFASWQFGELDYIDSIKNLQDGVRKRFPLYYEGSLLSFQSGLSGSSFSNIDLSSILLVFVNGVLQEPGYAYRFEGGTSFTFTDAPKPDAKVSIFFYRGIRDVDSISVNVNETIKIGDTVKVKGIETLEGNFSQDPRVVYDIVGSDIIETNLYTGSGIDSQNYRFFDWIKQKVDIAINGEYVYKTRDSLESQVYPTARIIKNVTESSTSIFVDNIELFDYEENDFSATINTYDALIVAGSDPVSAGITAIVSDNGTIESLSIGSSGSGYTQSSPLEIKISAPKKTGVGIGTTATATVNIVNGSISGYTITNEGLGYSKYAPPQVIVPLPESTYGLITLDRPNLVTQIARGFSGIITGITTSTGVSGNPLALKFFLRRENNAFTFDDLNVDYPVYIFNTNVGTGVTSIDYQDTSIVAIGTQFLDNVYYVHSIVKNGPDAVVTANIKSNSNIVGIATTGSLTNPVGNFSWGILSDVQNGLSNISIGVTGLTVDSGLSTFPTIQRRNYGLRDSGSLRKSFT